MNPVTTQNLFWLLEKKSMTTAEKITIVCNELKEMLLKKNASYGDSALSPAHIFSRADAEEGIKIRIDDKLSRLKNGNNDFNEDTVLDLMGYLIFLRICRLQKTTWDDEPPVPAKKPSRSPEYCKDVPPYEQTK